MADMPVLPVRESFLEGFQPASKKQAGVNDAQTPRPVYSLK